MIVLNLKAKNCMPHLLLKPTFDSFSFIEGELTTFNKFTFDGYIQKEFFEEAPEKEFSDWKDLREICFSLIKGKRTPLGFKFVLSLNPKHFEKFIDEALMRGANEVKIIHGRGTGKLKSAVHLYLKSNKSVSEYRIGDFNEGNGGVTIVKFK